MEKGSDIGISPYDSFTLSRFSELFKLEAECCLEEILEQDFACERWSGYGVIMFWRFLLRSITF